MNSPDPAQQQREECNGSANNFRVSLFISLINANLEVGIKSKTATGSSGAVGGVQLVQSGQLNITVSIRVTLITRPWKQQKPLTQ